jgi:hypothetical protein
MSSGKFAFNQHGINIFLELNHDGNYAKPHFSIKKTAKIMLTVGINSRKEKEAH